ncbi:DUF418 domain-containing protein [Lysobacter sp. A3-1-A15]|uniref:DUF418 domain-containing protein n=1 Tax=Novilysobacter viscosus TaxID=3098602 RepID=UPI002ED9298D
MTTTTVLTPVAAGERIEAMDVLRGFALLGILLMNIEAFVGPLFAAITGLDPSLRGADRAADSLIYIFVQGKFYTLFSLLFGMGFAVMIARAHAADRAFVPFYLRRTLALLGFGLVHALLVWSGDILTVYALIALVLLLFRNTPQSRLPKWGIALYLVPVALMLAFGLLSTVAQGDPQAAAAMNASLAEQGRIMDEALQGQRQAYGSGSYAEAVAQRAEDLMLFLGHVGTAMGWQILGLFLLGAWFVRSGAIARPDGFPRLYAWMRWVALPAGLAMALASFWLMPTMDYARMDMAAGGAIALSMVGSLLMCLGYAAWLVRGLQSPRWAGSLGWLAPAGRMALTNYLTQSVVCTLLFYGYGLGYFEQLSRAWQVPFVLALFALQVVASRAWLSRFRYGPAEWVWRALTYGQLPAMRAVAPAH